jgi:hypothetical protein
MASTSKSMGDPNFPLSEAEREAGARRVSGGDVIYALPVSALGPVAKFIAMEGKAEALKRFGRNLVRTAEKYAQPVRTQKNMKAGDRKTPEEKVVVFANRPGQNRTKGGLENMSKRLVSREEGKKLLAQDNARKLSLSTAVSMAKDKVKTSDSRDNQSGDSRTARLKPLTDAKEVKQRPEPKQVPPQLKKRKGPSYSDDMTQDDYGLREKVRMRDKAKEENIGEAAAEANLKKGGTVRKAKPTKYGMKHGGFTKRGSMYKKGMS